MSISINKKKNTSSTLSFLNKDLQLAHQFNDKKKEAFYKELTILLKSGIDIEQALSIIIEQLKKEKDIALINDIKENIIRGKSMYEALTESKKFSVYESYSIKIGEETKNLVKVLEELQLFFDRKIKMRRQLVSVLTYPAFVISITFGVLYFMLNSVVPMFTTVFQQFGGELPKLTQQIIYLSEILPIITFVIFLLIGGILTIHYSQKQKVYYKEMSSLLFLKIPFIGKLIQTIYLARFCQSMNLLLAAKTPLVTALDLVQKMISYYPIEKSIIAVKKEILRGSSFGAALKQHPIFDSKLTSMITVGEQINELDGMFEKLTNQYNEEVDYKTKMIGVVLEPFIIIIIGLIVGVIMIAMYSPMFNLSKIINPN